MEALLSLVVKDECPKPTFYKGKKEHSLVIPLSLFKVDEFEKEGPSSFLSVLRQQYPDGLRVGVSKLQRIGYQCESYAEISFHTGALLQKALSTPFNFNDRAINTHKTLTPATPYVYSVKICNIDSLSNNTRYKKTLLWHLGKFGTVHSLHLHYCGDGDWFTGEGCAILFSDQSHGFSISIPQYEGCSFVVQRYSLYYG